MPKEEKETLKPLELEQSYLDWDYSRELLTAKRNKFYHEKMKEYFEEEIRLLTEKINEQKKR